MKLRNKRTGEIVEYDSIGFRKGLSDGWEDFTSNAKSLDELNEVWEDHEPTEPLIKDEKIRKAVRAWAKAEGETQVHVTHCRKRILSIWTATKDNGNIDFDCDIEPFDEGSYIITELCGDDEE